MRRMTRDHTIQELRAYFADRDGVVAAYLFGSVARGGDRQGSDVDVGVLLESGRPQSIEDFAVLSDMQDELQDRLRVEVDVVALNGAAPDFLHRVLRDGELLVEHDHRARMLFELHARMEYFDILPTLQLYRRTVLGGL